MVKRSDILAFLGTTENTASRMSNFTEFSESKNPKEYTRQYVDEDFERTDITGYSPSISYSFDYEDTNAVHKKIKDIADNEQVGDAAIVDIIKVDLTTEGTSVGSFKAVLRRFSVVPDSEGGEVDRYSYSGNLKANGDKVFGTATTTDAWKNCTFTADAN